MSKKTPAFVENVKTHIRLSSFLKHLQYPSQIVKAIKFAGHFYRNFKQEEKIEFKDTLSLVLIIKDEARYLAEWIEYHQLVGVDRFYIYDNESTDNIKEILDHYGDEIVYNYWPGRSQQIAAYDDAVAKYKLETKWMGFIDTDEFIVPVKHDKIMDVINEINPKWGLGINWINYGDSHLSRYSKDLVIERFNMRAPLNHKKNIMAKSIINPRAVFLVPIHRGCFLGFRSSVDENGKRIGGYSLKPSVNKIRVNHYFGKTYEEFLQKTKRGDVETPNGVFNKSFEERNTNDIHDDIMAKYVDTVKSNLKAKGLLTKESSL
jgi:hypothetical protein